MIMLKNASNHNTMMEAMEKLLCQHGILRCFSHIINITVKTGLKYLTKPPEIDAEVDPNDIMESFEHIPDYTSPSYNADYQEALQSDIVSAVCKLVNAI